MLPVTARAAVLPPTPVAQTLREKSLQITLFRLPSWRSRSRRGRPHRDQVGVPREFDQLGQAGVGDAVVDRPAAALALDEPRPSQDAERVGNGVLAGVDRKGDVPDAELPATAQCRDDAGAYRISEHTEELGEIAASSGAISCLRAAPTRHGSRGSAASHRP
jgi:hypothetical protein